MRVLRFGLSASAAWLCVCVCVLPITSTSAFVTTPPPSFRTVSRSVDTDVVVNDDTRRFPCLFSSSSSSLTAPNEDGLIECDVLIVGGGPAGCTCALYTARSRLKTIIIDKNPTAGALAITSTIANYPGVDPTMSGQELLDRMREQAVQYGAEYRREQVFMLDLESDENDRKKIYTPEGTYAARSLVLATGAMGRKPTLKGEGELLGQGVSYCATCDAAFYQQSPVAVVGHNSEAVDEALHLTRFASVVHWVTSNDVSPDDDPHAAQLLEADNVVHHPKTSVRRIEGDPDAGGVTGLTVAGRTEGEDDSLIEVEGVFIYVAGSKPITDYAGSALKYQEDGGVAVDEEMATSIPGVYAIGDIRNTPFKQVVVAAGDGCVAAMAVDKYLKGRTKIKVDWVHT